MRFHGLNAFLIKGLSIEHASLQVENLEVRLVLGIAAGRPVVRQAEIGGGRIAIRVRDRAQSTGAVRTGRLPTAPAQGTALDHNALRKRINAHLVRAKRVLGYLPGNIGGQKLSLSFLYPGYLVAEATLDRFRLESGHFTGQIRTSVGDQTASAALAGKVDAGKDGVSLALTPLAGSSLTALLFSDPLRVQFAGVALHHSFAGNDSTAADLAFTARELCINHASISADDLLVSLVDTRLRIDLANRSFALVKPSSFVIGKMELKVGGLYRRNEAHTLDAELEIPLLSFNDFFDSFPGVFKTLDGVLIKGEFSYTLHYTINFDDLFAFKLDNVFKRNNFEVVSRGMLESGACKLPFVHRIIEDGQVLRTIPVGSGMAGYTPLTEAADCLARAVVASEDGAFFRHKGLSLWHMGYAMSVNFREKRFARGGSTITMQLVRNLFLNKRKYLFRKLEEIIITLLIEELKPLSKREMLEIYLNIIEWGPGVYGIREAAQFYFGKQPGELDMSESIFLTFIIPRPKSFIRRYPHDPVIIKLFNEHFDFAVDYMLRKNLITIEEFTGIDRNVKLKNYEAYVC
jgi:hypothetical protein